jgi:hypothetical protein
MSELEIKNELAIINALFKAEIGTMSLAERVETMNRLQYLLLENGTL